MSVHPKCSHFAARRSSSTALHLKDSKSHRLHPSLLISLIFPSFPILSFPHQHYSTVEATQLHYSTLTRITAHTCISSPMTSAWRMSMDGNSVTVSQFTHHHDCSPSTLHYVPAMITSIADRSSLALRQCSIFQRFYFVRIFLQHIIILLAMPIIWKTFRSSTFIS